MLDPIAAWSFSGDAQDDTGNENDGTVQGATLTDDRFGNPESAYSFDGDDTIGIVVYALDVGGAAAWTAAITGLCAAWWVLEPVPIPVTSMTKTI